MLRRNIKTKRPNEKLDFKKLGAFKISKKLLDVNYELSLPLGIRIYPVFHISLLELVLENTRIDEEVELDYEI